MHKFIFLLLCIATSVAVAQSTSPSQRPFTVPRNGAWKHTSMSGPAEAVKFREFVFVSDGRWRVEIDRGGGRKSIVFAYDGRSYFSNSPGKSAQDFNPISVLEPLYASFPDPSAMPVENLGGIRCWRYTEKTQTTTLNAWIDTRSRLLRKLSTAGFGAETTDIYEPITVDAQKIAARILDPEPMLIQ